MSHDQLWTALVTVSSLWNYTGHFLQAFATSHPTPHPQPPTLAKLAQNWCAPSKPSSTKDGWPNTSKSWLHQLKFLKQGFPQSLPGAS